nr:PH domain-containing protein [Croceicoccus gelatinilyticus]
MFVLPPVTAFAKWWFRRYRTGPEDIRVESGVLSREARSVPYERIQDVSLSETLLSRLFGLVEVRFETGAGGKDDLTLAFLTKEEGARLRDLVRARRDEGVEVETVTQDAAENEGTPIFAMDLKRVLLSGVFSFSLVIFAVLFAAIDQIDFLLPISIWDGDFWELLFSEQGERIRTLGRIGQIGGAIVAVLSVIVIGVVSGVVKTLLRDYGFRLDRTDKGFRRRRGLFTRTDVVMPRHRVQAVATETGVIRRFLGWHSLSFISLASDGGKASHDVAPFARWDEIAGIARQAGIALPEQVDWHRTSRAYWIDRAIIWLPIALLALGVTIWMERWVPALIPMALVLMIVFSSLTGYLRHRHALEPDRIHARAGLLSPRTMTAPRVRLQSAQIVQGPIARLRGYATLHFGLAGGVLLFRGLPVEEARSLREAVLQSIDAVDYSALPR